MKRPTTRLILKDWTFDPGDETFSRDATKLRLDPVELDVLLHLVDEAPNLVTVDALLDRNWPGVVVGDNVVHRVIARLRKGLGDAARQPSYIETLPRRGYRLICPVEHVGEALRSTTSPDHKIAVLPFSPLGSDERGEAIGDAIADDILNGLVRSTSIDVIARSSSFQYRGAIDAAPGIGRALGADYLLDGSVQIAGDRLRVTARLMSAVEDRQLWSERSDGSIEEIFALQDRIVAGVLNALDLFFRPRERTPTTNAAAYTAFVEGKRHAGRREMPAARRAYERALVLDPNYTEAHIARISLAVGKVFIRQSNVSMMRAEVGANLDEALETTPENHLAQATQSSIEFFVDRDMQGGVDRLQRVLRERPNEVIVFISYAAQMRTLGRHDQMIETSRRAVALDPLTASTWWRLAEDLLWAGHVAEAQAALVECRREKLAVGHMATVLCYLKNDRVGPARLIDDPEVAWDSPSRRALYAAEFAYDDGDRDEVIRQIANLERFRSTEADQIAGPAVNRTVPGSIALLAGDLDAAVRDFEYLLDESFSAAWFAPGLAVDPALKRWADFDKLRYPAFYADARVQRLINERGIDAANLATVKVDDLPWTH